MPLRDHFRPPLDNISPNRSISGLRSAAPDRSRLSLEARRRLLAPGNVGAWTRHWPAPADTTAVARR